MTPDDSRYEECRHCEGSGSDDGEWEGRCFRCGGKGEVLVTAPTDEDEGDDERYQP